MEKEDVNEAMRLMEMSKDSLTTNQEHARLVTMKPVLCGVESGTLMFRVVSKMFTK